MTGLVIDDFDAVSIEDAGLQPYKRDDYPTTGTASRAVEKILQGGRAYDAAGLLGSPHKDVLHSDNARIMGAEVDSSSSTRALRLTTVAAPARKRLSLAYISLELSQLSFTPDALIACLVGGWVNALLYRRPMMSLLQNVCEVPMSSTDQEQPTLIPLTRKAADELVLLSTLCPYMVTDLAAEIIDTCYSTASSEAKGAIVSTSVPRSLARALYRTGRRKSSYSYNRMLSRHQAILRKIDWPYEEKEDEAGLIDEDPTPERPRAFRFHFIDICGGAGKVAKALAS